MHDRPLTTVEAAAWLGFQTTSGIRRLVARGQLHPIGRGARNTYLFSRTELAQFARSRLPSTACHVTDGGRIGETPCGNNKESEDSDRGSTR